MKKEKNCVTLGRFRSDSSSIMCFAITFPIPQHQQTLSKLLVGIWRKFNVCNFITFSLRSGSRMQEFPRLYDQSSTLLSFLESIASNMALKHLDETQGLVAEGSAIVSIQFREDVILHCLPHWNGVFDWCALKKLWNDVCPIFACYFTNKLDLRALPDSTASDPVGACTSTKADNYDLVSHQWFKQSACVEDLVRVRSRLNREMNVLESYESVVRVDEILEVVSSRIIKSVVGCSVESKIFFNDSQLRSCCIDHICVERVPRRFWRVKLDSAPQNV